MGSKWYRQFLSRGVSGGNGALGNLDKKALEKCKLMLPGRDERDAIGALFRDLDDLIALHQRKHEKLCKAKTALLGKMFPKPGSDVPELRFPGFTDSWEQRKLGEFYEFKNGLNKSKEFFGHGTPIVNFTDVFNNRGLTASSLNGRVELTRAEIKTFEVCQGDIFFTRTSETIEEIGYPSVMLDQPKRTAFSGFVIRGRASSEDPLSDDFKRYVFFTNAFRKEMTKKSSMTTRALTSGTALRKMAFVFPASKDEQNATGALLFRLDDLITLHQRKLEMLRKVKKSLLEKMFV